LCRESLANTGHHRDELVGALGVYKDLEAERLDAIRSEALLRKELEDRWSLTSWLLVVGGAALVGFGTGVVVGL